MAIKRKFKWVLIIFSSLFILLILSFFLLRNNILQSKISSIQERLKKEYHADLFIEGAKFSGLNNVSFKHIIFKPEAGDTLLKIDSIGSSLNLFKLLFGKIKLNHLFLKDAEINLIKKTKGGNNFSFLFKKEKDSLKTDERNYSNRINELADRFYDKIPASFKLKNFKMKVRRESDGFNLSIPDLNFSNDSLNADSILIIEGKKNLYLNLKGSLNTDKRTGSFTLNSSDSKKTHLDFLDKWKHLKLAFHSLNLSIKQFDNSSDNTIIIGNLRADSLLINHPKLTTTDAFIKNFSFDFKINAGKNNIALDSSSAITLNKIILNPYLNYIHKSNKEKEYFLKLNMPSIIANDFFSSLPDGIFDATNQIKANGSFSYHLDFYMNSKQPDSLKFHSSLKSNNFKINQFGKANLAKMSGPFEYTAYSYGMPVQSFIVGPENPSFTPINDISPYLKNAVLSSEDGIFYFDNGFNEEMFAKAIADDYKTGKFTRGASTITMQLVKNVYLSKNKTVGRKVEEALIVWLIENNHLCSKDRMFEVYLNIIEWGPGIYGIGEASQFYFNVKPSKLNLSESIFLASIIPSPKWFQYDFEENGKLKEDRLGFFKMMSGILYKKGIITEEMYNDFKPEVKLKGKAKSFIIPKGGLPKN